LEYHEGGLTPTGRGFFLVQVEILRLSEPQNKPKLSSQLC
jgi:hypothetical protein